jgi:hypothetical protein
MVGRPTYSVGPTFMVGLIFFGRAMLALLQGTGADVYGRPDFFWASDARPTTGDRGRPYRSALQIMEGGGELYADRGGFAQVCGRRRPLRKAECEE